ncbi:hypothetical protein SteCoe_3816 [Stentor coeruleus]|uniref:RING-type domain-containing protein n=1 Tax=Stentor coeruleus TaxID=5963 RepID=A0A1R2CW50_9CILI|nr:hypothetical protein SteCoe_3816 [Stentor coeruleus]
MGNRPVIEIEVQEMVPTNERRQSSAPLVLVEEDKAQMPRTTPVPHIKTSCHLITDSFVLKDSNIFSFIFDSLTDCKIIITPKVSASESQNPENYTKTFLTKPGLNQEFCGWPLDFSLPKTDLSLETSSITTQNDIYTSINSINLITRELKIVLECQKPYFHCETSIVIFRKNQDSYIGEVKIQKLLYKGKNYILKELFGDNQQDDKLECAVCLCNKRDTVIIPCYHLCLCASCGNMLRVQSYKKCPMCRCEAEALLKISSE